MRQTIISFLCFIGMKDMPFKFIPEMPDGCGYRPGSSIAKRTNRVTFYFPLNIPQQVYITHLSFSIFDVLQDLFHPTSSLTAGRTLTTTLMAIEPCQCQGMPHHTLVFIQHNKSARAHHGTSLKTTICQAFISHHPGLSLCCFQQQVGRKDGYRRSARYAGLQLFAIGYTTTIFIAIDKFFY